MKFKDWVISEAATEKIIVFHGTSPKNYKAIMSQGLTPNPKKRAWAEDPNSSFYSPSRQSLDGIYVSTNLMTATSAAGNGSNSVKDGKLIITAEIQPKTGFMDEDNLRMLDTVSTHEYTVANLYGSLMSGTNQEMVKENLDSYIKNFFETIKRKKEIHPSLEARLTPLIKNMFQLALARQMVYSTERYLKYDYPTVPMPNKQTAEMDYLKMKDVITRTLKSMANPANLKEPQFSFTSRIMEPIRFNGPNRILCIVYEPFNYKEQPEILYGTPPNEFIQQWTARVGQWNPKSNEA
jgi:hypothetical protein